MKIIFSRKGFDGGSGGCPSPIVCGVPLSIPIPQWPGEPWDWSDIVHPALGRVLPHIPRGARIPPQARPHWDPMFCGSEVIFGQQGASESHLKRLGVGPGDLILFWGLFRDYTAQRDAPNAAPHHRIFGWMRIGIEIMPGASAGAGHWRRLGLPAPHPHSEREGQSANNTIRRGRGGLAMTASDSLRLTAPSASPCFWKVPGWLTRCRMSYHMDPARWSGDQLSVVARGQEFVADPGDDQDALNWAEEILGKMGGSLK